MPSRLLVAALLFLSISMPIPGTAATVVQARDFGAIGDGEADDGPALRRALAEAKSKSPATLALAPGRYRLLPEAGHGFCLELDAAAEVTVAGAQAQLIVADPRAGCFRAQRCAGVTLTGLVIDYDPPPFTQGRIATVDGAAGTIDLQLDEGFPELDLPWFAAAPARWGMVFDAQERRLKAAAPDYLGIDGWERLPTGGWRLRLGGGPAQLAHLAVGDRFVQLARGYGGGAAAFWGCSAGGVDGVTVRASNGVAVALLGCSGMRVERLQVEFAPGTRRLITTDADGVHCQQNRGGPTIEGCSFTGMADDAINIYTVPDPVRVVRSPTVLEVEARCAILACDRLQVFDPLSGRLRAEVAAVAVEPAGAAQVVTLDRAVADLSVDADPKRCIALYDRSASGEGYVIRGNRMHDHRRHGTLLRAGGGLVEGNTYEDLGGFAVVVANEPDWPEGPLAREVIIRGNRIARVGRVLGYGDAAEGASIQVRATRLGHLLAEGHGQRGISIVDDTVEDAPGAALYLGSVEEVRVEGLRVTASPGAESRRRHAAIEIENAGGVIIERLVAEDRRPGTVAAVLLRATVDTGAAGARVDALDAHLPEGVAPVRDERVAATPAAH